MKHEVNVSIDHSKKTDEEVICMFRAALKNTALGTVVAISCRTEGKSEWFPEKPLYADVSIP
jgi:hypothetical protein